MAEEVAASEDDLHEDAVTTSTGWLKLLKTCVNGILSVVDYMLWIFKALRPTRSQEQCLNKEY